MQGKLELNTHSFDVHAEQDGNKLSVSIDNKTFSPVLEQTPEGFLIHVGEDSFLIPLDDPQAQQLRLSKPTQLSLNQQAFDVAFRPQRPSQDHSTTNGALESDEDSITAFMPGTIVKIHVHNGQQVSCGEVILILEAMKMENEIKAPRDCTIEAIHTTEGASVNKGEVLIQLSHGEPPAPTDA